MSSDASPQPGNPVPPIGIIGGTGRQGRGLAYRLAVAGRTVLLGSRREERAREWAARLMAMPRVAGTVRGARNAQAASAALVIATLPYPAHADTLGTLRGELAGATLIDCTNPIRRTAAGIDLISVPAGSAAEEAAAVLPDTLVAAALHHVSSASLINPANATLTGAVPVYSDHPYALEAACALIRHLGALQPYQAGRLRGARDAESRAPALITASLPHADRVRTDHPPTDQAR
ncbi:NAD(P)-binding domain-containing protein [Actinocatenispora sera]|uniref:NADPH-dependent F420 reductase n=1 Tax=Actinocatenispora sera TaxID=390989 RepID=UPI00340C7E88